MRRDKRASPITPPPIVPNFIIVISYWLLVISYWLLVISYWLLVIGYCYWLLVRYSTHTLYM
ncbi:MAG: hypothetical protein EAZ60_07350 [Oscillatoriales cyanobacterium]|nr:MAG: hypothetical protein EAZ83_30035 [Oscillatoriales cyanobacterium]TAE96977.1 MAG: hypothetical protein EAZ79_12620 [Oscillatoriales cyanobacterium]TAF13891.1 MAG: hypothetical protein EAZ73_29805 [Oscillatoriales cyanobacterium]TAF29132.1 MAG: hypothetical protein EAZ69_25445 [Oscillatoriales cyanobacterium]TAF57323.1 MAG: hypothetical protein EAZ60_07350 [Oscillatoriales cyanobacterium]